jgi:hypothetical protein
MYEQWNKRRKELGDIDDLIEEVEMPVQRNEAYDFNVEVDGE